MELVVSLFVVGLLSAICAPLIADFYQKTQFNDTVHVIEDAILQARQAALSKGLRSTLCPYLNDHTCGEDWGNGLLILQSEQPVYQHQGFPHHISLTLKAALSQPHLVFDSMGFTNQNGHFIVSQQRGTCLYTAKIMIRKSGHWHTIFDHTCEAT